MTVGELVEMLLRCDPRAPVRIMSQENWPFECGIDGIATRADLLGRPDADAEAGHGPRFAPGSDLRDVFIVEGRQERFGTKRAWEVCARS